MAGNKPFERKIPDQPWIERVRKLSPLDPSFYLVLVLLIAAYVSLAKLGLVLASLHQNASPVWPATGFAIALVSLLGRRYAAAVTLGAFLTNYWSGLAPLASMAIAFGNSLEAIVGGSLYAKIKESRWFASNGASFGVILSSLLGSSVSTLVGILALYMSQSLDTQRIYEIAFTWWIGDVIGGLTVMPLLLSLARGKALNGLKVKPQLAVLLLGLTLGYLIFERGYGAQLLFFTFPFLLLCTISLGRTSTFIAATLINAGGIASTYLGKGIFNSGNLNADLVHLQIFISSVALTAIFLPDIWRSANNRQTAIVLFSSWLLAAGVFYSLLQTSQLEIELNFAKVVAVAKQRVHLQTEHYLTTLKSGVGLLNAAKDVKRSEWKAFAKEIDLQNKKSGILGIGVVTKVPAQEIERFIAEKKAENKDFTYKTLSGAHGPLDEALIITYVEPESINAPAIGLDIASETNRNSAALRARTTGEATVTSPIKLVQSDQKQFGFLILQPFYSQDTEAHDEPSRARNLHGFIYSPVIADSFFKAALGPSHVPELSYSIHDSESHALLSESEDFASLKSHRTSIAQTISLEIAGRQFILEVRPSAQFSTVIDFTCSWAGATIAVIGLLLASLVSNLQSTRERVEEIVEERSKQLEMAGRMARVGGWEIDRASQVVSLSMVAKEILEYSDKAVPSLEEFTSFLTSSSLSKGLMQQIWNHNFSEKPLDTVVEILTVKRRKIWIRIIAMSLLSPFHPEIIYGTIQDLTEQKARDLQLIHSSKMASLGEMASGVAHEINNPLAIIGAKVYRISQILSKESMTSEPLTRELDEIGKTVRRIANIIKGLKTFSRNGDDDPLISCQLSTVIDDTLYVCSERFKNMGIELLLDQVPDQAVYIRPTQISQVLLNLLNNAYDAIVNLDKKWIRISYTLLKDGMLAVSVSDSGVKIPDEVAERIMQPFFTTKEIGKGTGIGLSISKGIMQSHGGDLRLDRAADHTTFIFTVPCEKRQAA
jgi:C4-dicarboxylate-specific signal transduction histidine kinase/integral membrane sensor domain MASE1